MKKVPYKSEKYAEEASRLVELVRNLKEPLKLLQMVNEYPLLKDLNIFTRAQLLVNPPYSKERVRELEKELFHTIYSKLEAKDSKSAKIEQETKEIYDKANYASKRTFKGA
jgi:hypothetical protein